MLVIGCTQQYHNNDLLYTCHSQYEYCIQLIQYSSLQKYFQVENLLGASAEGLAATLGTKTWQHLASATAEQEENATVAKQVEEACSIETSLAFSL